MEEVFTDKYEHMCWGNDSQSEDYNGSSGPGSDLDYNIHTYIPFLKSFIIHNNIHSIVDLGCGNFKCGPSIYDDIDVVYTGYDAYNKVVLYNSKKHALPKYTFCHLDFFTNKTDVIAGDLCIVKDVLQHWCLEDIHTFLDYLVESKKFKYILISNCGYQTEDNTNITNGEFRPLSCDFYPLKKYNPTKLYCFDSKEVSLISQTYA